MDQVRDEKRVVTVLFADLVGSTALAERLDPEEVRLVVGEAVARMVRAVEAYGGTVKDLAGDGCLAFFGAPVTHEDDAERAVRTGLRIVRELDNYGHEVARSWAIEGLAARVGIATGPVVTGMVGAGDRVEYAAFGDTVNTAARLQSAAEPDGVICDAATQRLLTDRFGWSAPASLELKGKQEPVTAYRLLPPSGSTETRPAATQATNLVGRQAEMGQLGEAASALAAGSGSIVVLAGEPGIGKSRLVAELRQRLDDLAGAPAALWLEGRCLSYGESLPYWPFRDLLRNWLGVSADDPPLRAQIALRRRVEELFEGEQAEIRPYLASLLELDLDPADRARLAELSPEAQQYRTWEVVGRLLTRLAADAPLVVVLEDLHWADPTSLSLAEKLLAVSEEAAVMLLLTHRAERDHPSWRLREAADREFPHRTRMIDLAALPGAAERELLDGLVGINVLPPAVASDILAAAEGNPFFLEELVRSMADAGALVRDGDHWRFDHAADVHVPPTVGQVINARLDRLDPAAHDVVRAAAVLGRRFDLPLLAGVTGDRDAAQVALRELQRLDLVREAQRWPRAEYQFKHALIQEAAYATLLESQRRALHRRAATWLEERPDVDTADSAGVLAHHWLAADDEGRATHYLALAGDKARAEHALDESIGHYRALLRILERRGERQRMALVLFKLAIALHFDLRFAEANAAYQEAFSLWQPPVPAQPPTATLVILRDRMPDQVDPPRSYTLPSMQVQYALLDRLVELWPERTIVPSLADHWQISNDGLHYVFRLREGVHWSDGTPLTAADVEFGIKRNLDRQRPGVSVAMLFVVEGAQDYYHGRSDDLSAVGIRALDERHIEFRLNVPAPAFLNILNRADAGPVPRHIVERAGDEWTDPSTQVVSGAFRRTEWSEERVVLERRPDYSGARVGNVRRVEIHHVPSGQAGAKYAWDEADIALTYDLADEPELSEFESDRVPAPFAWCMWLYFRTAIEPFDRPLLRRALAHSIDREALAKVLPPDASMIARGGLVPPALHGHTPDISLRFDVQLARELLAESGVRPHIRLYALIGRQSGQMMRVIADSWRQVLRLEVELREVSVEAYTARREPTDTSAEIVGWVPGYPDPEYFLRLLLHSEAKDNFGGYSNPRFDELIERASRERDVRRRLELFHEADRLAVAEDAAVIPLSYERDASYVKPWVSGWWEYGKAWSSFADLIVDERSPRFRGPD
jgi:ABC-type oligopeptide transport system substrate-binding subunit/class 3 adenylate cyclase